MPDYALHAAQIAQRIQELARVSEDENCLTRTYGTPAFQDGARLVAGWMQAAGLNTQTDQMGNVRGVWKSAHLQAKTLVLGSHIDTVVNAGKFDGPLGVLLAIELLAMLPDRERLPFNVAVVGFCDEEGVRFHTTYLGSKALAGTFDVALLDKQDASGVTLATAIRSMGGDPACIPQEALPADEWLGYYEVHIEQGPVLEEKQMPVGLVSGIAGQNRAEIMFKGVAGHAGTVPMNMRQDALCAAADFILAAEALAKSHAPNLVATVGKLDLSHPASNVIPGAVTLSLDLRSAHADLLQHAYTELQAACERIGTSRNIDYTWTLVQQTPPVLCDPTMNDVLQASIQDAGFSPMHLVSGALHVVGSIADVAPIAMVVVRCLLVISDNAL